MANRRRAALLSLALLNVLTLGAGAAVAGLLPARLALWRIPRVAAAPLAGPGRVLAGGLPTGPAPTRQGLTAALSPLLASGDLGPNAGAVVTDLASGATLFSRRASSPATPASSAKLATATAALQVLGPGHRFATTVVRGAAPGSVVLVGGGDPTLAAGRPPAGDYPQPATLAGLAAATARKLRARHETAVRLSYDTSLFTGPPLAPGWSTSYISTGNVTPITSLEVDQGRLTTSGAPQDADKPDNYRPRSLTPARDAARAFAGFLAARGVAVRGAPSPAAAPAHATRIASVTSPPLSAIVAQMLRESNNVIAEDLARQVALRVGRPASFSGAAGAVTSVLARLGVSSGVHLVDGSGLSPLDRITPRALVRLVQLAASARRPALRPVLAGIPVAGFSGTLAAGQSVFGGFGAAARGDVRAKTGNLTTVASLTGLVDDSDGQVLAFSFMADQIPAGRLKAAAGDIDAMATALAGCGCR